MADENNDEIIQDSHNKLKLLLRNLFQFDTSDLDFGIYRIMHHKKKEIEKFIEVDLMGEIEKQFEDFAASSLGEREKRVEELKEKLKKDIGEDKISKDGDVDEKYRDLPVVEDYNKARKELKSTKLTQNQVNDVFNLVHEFFSRYFDKGDFLSKRRYGGKNHYTIPYNGEEVLLHWANRDQYYVKTGEHFRNYSFNIGNSLVSFKVKGAETESNNNKGENRYFILIDEDAIQEDENRSLTIWFHYRALLEEEKKKKQSKGIQEELLNEVVKRVESENYGLKTALLKKNDDGSSLLEKHLKKYVDKNTTDYFIHKDLRGFLNREIEFFIKNEVLDLDEMESMDEQHLKVSMARVRTIRGICQKIIDFLAQIEDFQKKLFEKKKFVIKTDYCMTLDNVPKALYPEILKTKDQLNEWKALYGAGEDKQSTITSFGSMSIDEAYLKEHPFLVIDTKFFDREFKDELLASFDDLDEATGGLMIKSENWQALNLMQEKYREKVKCIYMDPPYNTGNDEFLYKDKYRHSSWLTMMENRLRLSKELLEPFGFLFEIVG